MPDLSGVPVVGGALNAVGVGMPDPAPAAAPVDPAARNAVLGPLIAKHGGVLGSPSPVTTKLPASQIKPNGPTTQATGYNLVTFADGSSIEIDDTGATQNYKESTAATKTPPAAPAPANALAAAGGPVIVGSGANTQIWVKTGVDENGKAIYTQTDESKATQQLNDQKTAADTTKAQADAKKAQADAALAADPTNVALKQAKDAADIAQSQAATAASQAAIVHQQITDQLATAKSGPDIGLVNAQTGSAQATAAGTAANTAKTVATTPYDVQKAKADADKATVDAAQNPQNQQLAQAKVAADTAYQQALTQSVQQKGNEPTLLSTGTTSPTSTFWNPVTGKIEERPNAGYTPTDPGRMTVQLQQQARAQFDALQQQVTAGKLTADQADSQFTKYLQDNIDPVKADIAAAQAKAQGALDLQNAQTSNYQMTTAMQPATLAQTGSSDAQRNLISMLPYVVGASAATTPGITTGKGGFPQINPQQIMQNATYSLPNLQEVGRQGAAAALANISPTAQMHAQSPGPPGQPPVPGMPSPQDMLNRTAYGSFGGGGTPGGTPAPAAAGSGYNPNDIQWHQQANPASQPGRVVGPGGVIFNAQGQPEGTPPGMTPGLNNGAYQPLYPQAPAAGMPATGPVAGLGGLTPQQAGAGAGMGDMAGWGAGYGLNLNNLTPWSWPPYQPST
jgi:hypothetical protein